MVQARNNSGVTTSSGQACTVVDMAPPTTFVNIPQPLNAPYFTVNWSGVDAQSGVASYDVQVRQGAASWTPWFTRTTATSAMFFGQ